MLAQRMRCPPCHSCRGRRRRRADLHSRPLRHLLATHMACRSITGTFMQCRRRNHHHRCQWRQDTRTVWVHCRVACSITAFQLARMPLARTPSCTSTGTRCRAACIHKLCRQIWRAWRQPARHGRLQGDHRCPALGQALRRCSQLQPRLLPPAVQPPRLQQRCMQQRRWALRVLPPAQIAMLVTTMKSPRWRTLLDGRAQLTCVAERMHPRSVRAWLVLESRRQRMMRLPCSLRQPLAVLSAPLRARSNRALQGRGSLR